MNNKYIKKSLVINKRHQNLRYFLKVKFEKNKIIGISRTSLVAQWLRICLPMQGTWDLSLIQEYPTCCGTTKPVCHNY